MRPAHSRATAPCRTAGNVRYSRQPPARRAGTTPRSDRTTHRHPCRSSVAGGDGGACAWDEREDGIGDLHGVDRMLDDTFGAAPRGQPRVVPPADEDENGRRSIELVLELTAQSQPAGRRGLTVEDGDIDVALV